MPVFGQYFAYATGWSMLLQVGSFGERGGME